MRIYMMISGMTFMNIERKSSNRLDEFHYLRFKQGKMKFSEIVCCFSGSEDWEDMMNTI